MGILFPESGFNYKYSFRWGVNDYVIAAICILAVILSDIIYHSSFVTHYKNAINDSESRQHWSAKMKISLFIIILNFQKVRRNFLREQMMHYIRQKKMGEPAM